MKKLICVILSNLILISACACSSQEIEDKRKFTMSEQIEESEVQKDFVENSNVKEDIIELQNNSSSIGQLYTSDNNLYLLAIPQNYETDSDGWAIYFEVGPDFQVSNIQYLNGINNFGEPEDIHLNYQLIDQRLYITPGQYKIENNHLVLDENIELNSSLTTYENTQCLENIIVSIKDTKLSEAYVLYDYQGNPIIENGRIQTYTGDKIITDCRYGFSEGRCWVELYYADFPSPSLSLINQSGDILASFDSDTITDYSNIENGAALLTKSNGNKEIINSFGEIVISTDAFGKILTSKIVDPEENVTANLYEDGYIFLTKTESSFDNTTTLVALVDSTGNYIVDWIERDNFYPDGYHLSTYWDDNVFVFCDSSVSYRLATAMRSDKANFMLYNAVSGQFTMSFETYAPEIKNHNTIKAGFNTNGWFVATDTESYDCIHIIDTQNNHSYYLPDLNNYAIGEYSDGGFIIADFNDNKRITYLAFLDTEQMLITDLEFPYLAKINAPLYPTRFENVPYYANEISLSFSDGAMLVGMIGEDYNNYFTLINKNGEMLIDITPGMAQQGLNEGRFLVRIDNQNIILDSKGNEVFKTIKINGTDYAINIIHPYKEGLAYTQLSSGKKCFVDINGNMIIESDDLSYFDKSK